MEVEQVDRLFWEEESSSVSLALVSVSDSTVSSKNFIFTIFFFAASSAKVAAVLFSPAAIRAFDSVVTVTSDDGFGRVME